jgi:hypothetical protein
MRRLRTTRETYDGGYVAEKGIDRLVERVESSFRNLSGVAADLNSKTKVGFVGVAAAQ